MTTTWVKREPDHLPSLEAALDTVKTTACRVLAEGYLGLLAESGGAVPAKNGLDIHRFAQALPHLVLCAVTLPDRCVYRLAGEAMKRRVGVNLVGRNY